MSHVNIFKIKVVDPIPLRSHHSAVRNSPGSKNHQLLIFKKDKKTSNFCKIGLLTNNSRKKSPYRVSSQMSPSFNHQSNHIFKKQIKSDNQETAQNQKNLRPHSLMIKRSKKKIEKTYNLKLKKYSAEDLIFKKEQEISNEKLEDCVVFFKKKLSFARIVRSRVDFDWEPISNEYIAKIYGTLEIEEKLYFIVQNFTKSSIREIIDAFGASKQSLVKTQIRDLVYGLLHCHSRGIIHNRINPQTTYIGKSGNLLIDVAKSSGRTPTEVQKHNYYHYFSPEILTREIVAESCDVWAVGCLTLQLLSGNLKTSKHHPYNELCKASPSADKNELEKLREDCIRQGGKENQNQKEEQEEQLEQNLSKAALNFIKACLKLNFKARPKLSKLIDFEFLAKIPE